MLAQVTTLRYWKSEHTAETCEDAADGNSADGLFAVADGAGTTLFADAWAHFLVQHFLAVPLMSNDPFEAEWWVRLAQEQFKQEFAAQAYTDLAWNAQQKVQSQGSHSTLATLRFSAQDATHLQAELLVIGDSCIFIYKPSTMQSLSFPLQHATDFEQAPICIPSKTGAFNRYFHQFQAQSLHLAPGDVVVIATDAVAKWIVSAGNGHYADQSTALQAISQQTTASWATFIATCRTNKEMIDDDCTALIIMLQPDDVTASIALGTTTTHSQPVREQRKQEFLQALTTNNKERVAIYYGDGNDLQAEGVSFSQQDAHQARQVADAQREVISLLRQVVDHPNVVAIMTAIWQKHAHLLYQEPCATTIRATLSRIGVPIEPRSFPEPLPSVVPEPEAVVLAPQAPQQPVSDPVDELQETEMHHTQIFDVQSIQRHLQAQQNTEEV